MGIIRLSPRRRSLPDRRSNCALLRPSRWRSLISSLPIQVSGGSSVSQRGPTKDVCEIADSATLPMAFLATAGPSYHRCFPRCFRFRLNGPALPIAPPRALGQIRAKLAYLLGSPYDSCPTHLLGKYRGTLTPELTRTKEKNGPGILWRAGSPDLPQRHSKPHGV
jgi:hypothetical protein